MSFWQVIVPAAAKNLVTNPTPTTGSTGYVAAGVTLAIDATKTRRGLKSLKLTPTSAVYASVYYTVPLVAGVTYYASADIWGATNVPYRIWFGSTSGSTVNGTPGSVPAGDNYWETERPVASFTPGSNGNYRVYVGKNNSASTADFWVDGLMVQSAGSNCTYVDGDQPGCVWDAAPYASTSSRSNQSRDGGLVTDLDSCALAISNWDGVGMPDVNNIFLSYGIQDGAFYQRTKTNPRNVKLAGNLNAAPLQASGTLQTLLKNRQTVINMIKSDLVADQDPFWLRFNGGQRPILIQSVYDDGLRMNYGARNGLTETPTLNLVNPDPFWYEEGYNAASVAGSSPAPNVNLIMYRDYTTGSWSSCGSGLTGIGFPSHVYALARGIDGSIYAGGDFITAWNDGTGSVSVNYIAKWDPVNRAWSALGQGFADGGVRSIVVDPQGNVYVAGGFTTAVQSGGGSLTVNRIAMWDGTNWNALSYGGSVGISGQVNSAKFDPVFNNLYLAGRFTTAGSVTVNNITRWDGSAFYALSYGGSAGVTGSATINDVAFDVQGNVYIAGNGILTAGSVAVNNVAKWDLTKWVAIGGTSDVITHIQDIMLGSDGLLYFVGLFSKIGGVTAKNIATYNGVSWQQLGDGLNQPAYSLGEDKNGIIWAGGIFGYAGSVRVPDGIAMWNGTSWAAADCDLLPGQNATVWEIMFDNQNNAYFGFDGSSQTTTAAASTILPANNTGSAKTWLTIRVTGPGTLYRIQNNTAGTTIFFKSLQLFAGETLTISLVPGQVSVTSNYRGNMMWAVQPGSNLATFTFLSGVNYLGIFAPGCTASYQWRNRFWSIDGAAL